MFGKNKLKVLLIMNITVLVLAYQNFDFSTGSNTSLLTPVDQQSRVHHAKELLGSHYNGSVAEQAGNISDLQVTIYNDVVSNLSSQYQSHSLNLSRAIINEARANDMDPVFVMAVIKTESQFNPKARGTHGEIGLMQIKPDTAKWIAGQRGFLWSGAKTLENPVENVRIGVAYLSILRYQSAGFANKYVAAYNMGLAKVRRLYKKDKTPKEYSVRVMKNYREIYKRMIASRFTAIADN